MLSGFTRRRIVSAGALLPLARPAVAKLLWRSPGGGAVASPTLPAVSSIGTAPGRTFSTWDAWLAAVVALGKIRIGTYPNGVTGVGYPDSEFTPAALVIGGVDTSDFTGTSQFAITMKAAPGAGVQRGVPLAYNGNAATYNPANGVCLKFNLAPGSYPFDGGIVINRVASVTSSNILIQGLQLKLVAGNRVIDTDNNLPPTDTSRIVVSQCILESTFGTGVYSGGHTKFNNCLFLFRGLQDTSFCPHGGIFDGPAGGGAFFYGCTVVSPSDNTAGLPTGSPPDNAWTVSEGGSTTTWANCAFFGWFQVSNAFGSGSGSIGAYTNCITNSPTTTTDHYCQPNIATFTGVITGNTALTVSGVTGTIAIGQYLAGAGIINGTRQITGGSNPNWVVTSGANLASQAMETYLPSSPNAGPGVTGGVAYNTSTFIGTTSAAADFSLPSSSALVRAGTADPTNLSVDITGLARPLSGAIDVGCWEFTTQPLLVNGSPSPAAVVAGDGLHVQVNNIPSGTGVRVTLEDAATTIWNEVPGSGYIGYTSPTVDIDLKLSELNPTFGIKQPLGFSQAVVPGTFYIRLYYNSNPSVVQQQIALTVNSWIPYPFPLMNAQTEPNGLAIALISVGAAPGGTVLGGGTGFCPAVKGNIVVDVGFTSAAAGLSPLPTNITMQYYAVDGALTYHPIGNSPSTAPIFGNTPNITSFDTTTLVDGSYLIYGKVVDIADTSGQNYVAAIFAVVPQQVVIQNGASPMNPAGSYQIPVAYYGNNKRYGSTTPDAVPYHGVPVAALSSPYPSDAAVGNYLLPVYNTSSPFHSSPSGGRNPSLGFWWQGVDGVRTNEYRSLVRFSKTTAGGIFSQSWYGKSTGTESIEGGYPAVAAGSYRDGDRNSNQMSNFVTVIATPSTGPWSAYHWTFIQEDGRLGVMNLAGTKVTIAGYRLDPAQLQNDWEDFSGNPEFPNSIQVGTIDTNPLYTFSDFGGGAADCCWDPRDPYICYVSQTIDHCIIKVNFHTQTLSGVNYSASNPLCQRYAGYKGGLIGGNNANGTPNGGYADGPATVASGSGGAQFNGVYSITMQHRTDNSSYPIGTMFVCDNYNGLIRIVSAAAIDSNGNFTGAGPTVSTFVGTHSGTVPVSTAVSTPFAWNTNVLNGSVTVTVSSMTDNGDGTATVSLNTTPANPVTSIGWKMYVLAGGAPYTGGGSTYENSLGKYTVSAWTSSTSFSLKIHPVPTGALQVFIPVADTYSSPQPISLTNAYTAYPNTIRMTSQGDIVYGESWYNMMCRRIWLNNNPNTPSLPGFPGYNMITRLLPFGNNAFSVNTSGGSTDAPAFGWFAIDNPMIDPAVGTVSIGACGTIDDIVVFKTDSDPGSAANAYRFSLDLSYTSDTPSSSNWFGDGGPDFPSEGVGGVGHYPWGFCFSTTAFRMLSLGLQPSGWFQWRPGYPGDPDRSVDAIGGIGSEPFFYPYNWLDAGWMLWQQGSRGVLPYGFRPAISAMMGSGGLHQYGSNTGPTIDDLPGLYPSNPTLGAYIQGGFFGSVKRPELSFDDDGVTPGRALAALMYYIRRQAISGAWPTQQPALFTQQNVSDGSGQLIAPGQWSLNYIRPNITIQAGDPTRVSPTSIRVRWTTDKNTLGIVIAGTPNSNVVMIPFGNRKFLYNFWTTLEQDNGAVWGMTHDVTLTGLPANNVTPPAGSNAPNNVAVLVIDRAGNWQLSPNFVVS